ncbi:daptide-type RiPP [Streptomyces sp. NPDC092296]
MQQNMVEELAQVEELERLEAPGFWGTIVEIGTAVGVTAVVVSVAIT